MPPFALAEPVPLTTDADGVIRVGGSPVTLDTVIGAYRRGDTPEQIAQDYSALDAADIYAVIAYYLKHQSEMAEYLARRERQAQAVREEFQQIFPSEGLRERLKEEEPLLRMIDLAVETGIADLATNVDHYLYGHPKVGDAS